MADSGEYNMKAIVLIGGTCALCLCALSAAGCDGRRDTDAQRPIIVAPVGCGRGVVVLDNLFDPTSLTYSGQRPSVLNPVLCPNVDLNEAIRIIVAFLERDYEPIVCIAPGIVQTIFETRSRPFARAYWASVLQKLMHAEGYLPMDVASPVLRDALIQHVIDLAKSRSW